MNKPLLIRVMPALLLLVFTATTRAVIAPSGYDAPLLPTPTPMQGISLKEVEATFTPDKAAVMPGEPFYATIVVKNNSSRRIELVEAEATDTLGGPPPPFRITAKSAEAGELPQFEDRMFGYPLMTGPQPPAPVYHTLVIPPSGSHTFRVFVPRRVLLEIPGSYTLTAVAAFGTPMNDHTDATMPVLVTATAHVKVVPADKEKLDALAHDLAKLAAAPVQDAQCLEAAAKLSWFPDADGIPACIGALAKKKGLEASIHTMMVLSRITGDGAFHLLKKLVTEPDPPAGDNANPDDEFSHQMAASALTSSPNPAALPWLLTRWNDPSPAVRGVVLKTLRYKVPPDRALPILRKMADDKNSQIHDAVKAMLDNPELLGGGIH